MVVSALGDIGISSPAFTGAFCRMGGLTVATEAGVPESIMWMQSGHAHDRAARCYVRLTNPDRLYDTWRAFERVSCQADSLTRAAPLPNS